MPSAPGPGNSYDRQLPWQQSAAKVIKSATPWALAKASAGHFPPVDRHQNSRRREQSGERKKRTLRKGGRRKGFQTNRGGAKITKRQENSRALKRREKIRG